MARKAGQGKEEEESRARQQEEKTPVWEEEEKPACHGEAHHVVEQESLVYLTVVQCCDSSKADYSNFFMFLCQSDPPKLSSSQVFSTLLVFSHLQRRSTTRPVTSLMSLILHSVVYLELYTIKQVKTYNTSVYRRKCCFLFIDEE
ncbi:hypothetical protein STEG23_025012, partial [Scotinomys teguina]